MSRSFSLGVTFSFFVVLLEPCRSQLCVPPLHTVSEVPKNALHNTENTKTSFLLRKGLQRARPSSLDTLIIVVWKQAHECLHELTHPKQAENGVTYTIKLSQKRYLYFTSLGSLANLTNLREKTKKKQTKPKQKHCEWPAGVCRCRKSSDSHLLTPADQSESNLIAHFVSSSWLPHGPKHLRRRYC